MKFSYQQTSTKERSISLTKEDCYTSSGKYCPCIEFHLNEKCRHGFHTGQLIHYKLEPNPDAGEDKNAPPQKLTIAFSTADVVILGWRLGRLADLLRENDLATVHVLSKRYADLDHGRPFVASIIITPIGRSQS
ncbi:MAG TPA: hypothetical protein VL486_14935 [Verrucomicrobiae bacterium]|nr:hypothetical protein [Verrucomicrobiae bacterium]